MPKILREKWLWCVEKKNIRKITGYTVENEEKNFESWYRCAIAFYDAAIILYRNEEDLGRAGFAAEFNAALSIEIMLKAILVKVGKGFPKKHDLNLLFSDAKIDLTEDQKYMIKYLTEVLIWFKYPVPKTEKEWDRFYDEIFEGLVTRSQEGNAFFARANKERWPSFDNYMKLWDGIIKKYKNI